MILPCIDGDIAFPEVHLAMNDPDGLLCYGGDLTTQRLLSAYQKGIFPWYSIDEPIMWWSPSERMILYPNKLHISKSFKKAINKQQPTYHLNRNFETVINYCANVPRKDHGTWIHPEMIEAYITLFNEGHAFCLEVEVDGLLIGGIYGVALDKVLCGESMFSLQSNGSKFAMYGLCQHMINHGYELLDCQLHNPHLERMGAELISRSIFIRYLK